MNQPEVELEDLGLIDYKQCWDYQTKLFDASVQLKIKNRKFPENRVSTKNHLIFCEHPHVYTLGKSGDLKNLLIDGQKRKEKNISFYKINRGGDITYHGPGQLVVYPILDLDYFFSDIHKYLRLLAENQWKSLENLPLHIFRLAGIYGPGRGPFSKIRAGTAKRVVKDRQVFSRIHVEDIVQILVASLRKPKPGQIYNLCDDNPAPPQDVIAYSAELLGLPLPPLVNFEDAELSEMARSFYAENKRIKNNRIKTELGICLKYPNYRQGLKDLLTREATG